MSSEQPPGSRESTPRHLLASGTPSPCAPRALPPTSPDSGSRAVTFRVLGPAQVSPGSVLAARQPRRCHGPGCSPPPPRAYGLGRNGHRRAPPVSRHPRPHRLRHGSASASLKPTLRHHHPVQMDSASSTTVPDLRLPVLPGPDGACLPFSLGSAPGTALTRPGRRTRLLIAHALPWAPTIPAQFSRTGWHHYPDQPGTGFPARRAMDRASAQNYIGLKASAHTLPTRTMCLPDAHSRHRARDSSGHLSTPTARRVQGCCNALQPPGTRNTAQSFPTACPGSGPGPALARRRLVPASSMALPAQPLWRSSASSSQHPRACASSSHSWLD